MKRRNFLHKIAAGGVMFAGGVAPFGVARLMAPAEGTAAPSPSIRLRPPGALEDDVEFMARCIGCGICGEVCPQDAIQFYNHEGGAKVNTPFINPVVSACALTGDCMEACPTDALVVTPRKDVKMGVAQIDRSACYPWVDRGVCGACVPICPLGKDGIDF
ncbi:MAG: 4Fe-4S dicluster domain-containing protein, partial [Magnetococcales bacterium]|nr:4Fe-4S dicluster domain-containing protein [Magnetococcales bacterium]